MEIKDLFNKPKIILVSGDVDTGKSNFLYYCIKKLMEENLFHLYTYGLKIDVGGKKFHSNEELEQIKNSIIFVDEFFNLFDLEDTKKRKLIEKTMRLISHNNNILVLSGVPENFKKFIAGKSNTIIYLKSTLSDFINGSKIKSVCLSYKGDELGSSVLNLDKSEALIFNQLHYEKINVPYLTEFDTKKNNPKILISKNPPKDAKNILKKSEIKEIKELENGI